MIILAVTVCTRTPNSPLKCLILAGASASSTEFFSGPSGENFLKTLHLSKELAAEILGAWKVTQEKMCPLGALSALQKSILQAVLPGLAPAALEPCFIRGGELKNFGLAGRKISGALDRVRKAQWNGEIKNREEAMAFLTN